MGQPCPKILEEQLKIIIGKKMFDCSRCSGSPQSEELQDLAIFGRLGYL